MPEDRRHAAIMFTDIVGYTALMGSDEDKAFDMLRRNHAIHEKLIKQFDGTLIKEIGDGTLASFSLASDAVRCAMEIQKASKEEKIPLKIGIHEGEMVFVGSDVLGDGVNIASRLQESAEEGCVTISGSVYRDIKNKTGIRTEFIEEKVFKNVDEPIRIYSVTCEESQLVTSSKITSDSNLPEKKSIIVLPFVDISPDQDNEYFSDGLTEEIITDLSQIHDLLVISRNSTMTFKGSKKTTTEIAEKVNVRYVLEGSVRKIGNNLRIVAQLIDASNDVHLWAEKYSGTLDDVFDIQEKVSRSIVDSLKIKLSSNEKKKIHKRKIQDATAYEQYLLARYEILKFTKESLSRAVHLLNNSLKSFGKNEYLLTALAFAYFQYVNIGIDPDEKHLDKANELIEEALSLNQNFAKAHFIKSAIHETRARGNLKKAFKSIMLAVKLDPNDSDSLMMLAFLYAMAGRPQEAKPFAKKAIEADPLNPFAYAGEWCLYLIEGDFDKMLDVCHKMYNLDKENLLSTWAYAHALVYKNRLKKATRVFDLMEEKFPDQFLTSLGKALKHVINDEKQEALNSITEQVIKAAEMDHTCSWWLAEVYALIGEKSKAIQYLDRATRDIFINYPFFSKYNPLIENIREEEGFKKLMERVKYQWENFEV